MFAHNVKVIRLMKGMNQGDLAKYLGYGSTAAVCQWETNNAIPHFSTLDKIAKLGNITVDELLHKDINSINNERNKSDISSSIRINVYSSVHAGIPNEAIDEVVDWEDIPKEWFTSGREYFGVKVRGNSMEPEYRNGDTVIVQNQSTFTSGDDCIVRINGDEAVLRRVIKKGSSIILQPLNPIYPPEIFTGEKTEPQISINGVVRELRRKK